MWQPCRAVKHIEAIVLAGGTGSRFGGGKLSAPYRGGRLLDGAVRAALAAPVARVHLVTGYDSERVAQAALDLAQREFPRSELNVVHAADYAEGMSATLRAGVAALSASAEGAFVLLADMPRVPPSVAGRLAREIGPRRAAAPVFAGSRGHPVLFAAALFPALSALAGDRGASLILADLGSDLCLVEVDDSGVLFDVDLRQDAEH